MLCVSPSSVCRSGRRLASDSHSRRIGADRKSSGARDSECKVPPREMRPMENATPHRVISAMWLLAVVMAAGIAVGCARSPGVPSGAAGDGTVRSHRLTEGAMLSDESGGEAEADYDPWQHFNERIFAFNHDVLDGYLIKPAATGWSKVAPERARRSISHLFDNLDIPRRLVNNLDR